METSFVRGCRESLPDTHRESPFAIGDCQAKELKDALISSLLNRRRELRLTQAALSAKCGVAQTEISRIERRRKSPTLDTYSRLASALGLHGALSMCDLGDDPRPRGREGGELADGGPTTEPN